MDKGVITKNPASVTKCCTRSRNHTVTKMRRICGESMLYVLHELRHQALSPFLFWAKAGIGLLSNPYSALAYTPFSRNLAASYDVLVRLNKRYEKPAFDLKETIIDGKPVAVTEVAVIDKPFCR